MAHISCCGPIHQVKSSLSFYSCCAEDTILISTVNTMSGVIPQAPCPVVAVTVIEFWGASEVGFLVDFVSPTLSSILGMPG